MALIAYRWHQLSRDYQAGQTPGERHVWAARKETPEAEGILQWGTREIARKIKTSAWTNVVGDT